uniref:Uncharacterized protein n=1 Tax=Cannabis sativa TaxID=3483 RepID=A0A803NKC5_CANSA
MMINNRKLELQMKHNIMHDKATVRIVNQFSISKNKTQFLTGELHAFREDIKGRLMQTQLERATLRMSFVDHTTRPYKGISDYVDFMIQVQHDLATAFLDASEEEDVLWRKQLFDVENEINYHDALLFIYKIKQVVCYV